MLPAQSVGERWAAVVQHYQELHPKHHQEPMAALVTAVAEVGIRNGVWPSTSHFTLGIYSTDSRGRFIVPTESSLHVEYWREVDKFEMRYRNIQGIPFDKKWCELAEAQATLRYLFRQMREDDSSKL